MSFKLPTLVVILLAALEIAPLSSARIFLTGRNYPSGGSPAAAVVQDFNNDGIADIASANGTVSVFLGNSDGTFGAANTFPVGAGATEIASADLNGDGNADLVVTDDRHGANVVLGHGDGTFGRSSTIQLEGQPLGIAIADLNGDGILDLAIALFGPARPPFGGQVAVLLGVGDGSFAAPVFYDLTPYQGVRLVAIDLNHDGKLDLAVAVQHFGGFAVLLGNGDGTFQPAVTTVLGDCNDIAASDFNGDGNVDLVLTNNATVQVVFGNGDGTFQSAIGYDTNGAAQTVAIADLNHDGVSDLVVGGDRTAVLLGNGDGTFGSAVLYGVGQRFARIGYFNQDRDADVVAGNTGAIGVAFGTGHGTLRAPRPFVVGADGFDSADFDGDGHADVVIAGLFFLRGLGDGTFAPPVQVADLGARSLTATDLNNDGKPDLLVSLYNDSGIYTLLGNGDGTFQAPHRTGVSVDEPGLLVGDFNNDGKVDVALAGVFGHQLKILLGNGDGTFGSAARYGVGQRFARIGDFNHDRNADVVASGDFSAIGVAFGTGDGTLRAPKPYPGGYWGFDSADFDGDGHADVVDGAPLSFIRGLGDGTFAAGVPITGPDARFLIATDFNGDGKPDLLVTPLLRNDVGIYTLLGNGDGTFQAAQFTGISFSDAEMNPVVADFNNDGQMDVAVTGVLSDRLAILLGKGDGTFETAIYYDTGRIPESPVAADFNGDGNPDLAVCNAFDGTVGIYLGQGDGTFAPPLSIGTNGAVYSAAGDVNQDGKVDLLIGGNFSTTLYLGNGDGTFQPPQSIYPNYGPVKVADVDRDGRLDVTVSVGDAGGLVVLHGRGDGTFGSAVVYPIGGVSSSYFALSDLNGDAKPEAIVSDNAFSFLVLLNTSHRR